MKYWQQTYKVTFKLFGRTYKAKLKASTKTEAKNKLNKWLISQMVDIDILSEEESTLAHLKDMLNI